MEQLKYRLIREGKIGGHTIPLNLIYVDLKDVEACGLNCRQACERIAKIFSEPSTISVFDMDAVSTNSDGMMVEGAIVAMAAADRNRIHPEFGYLDMMEIPNDEKWIEAEPHLKQWNKLYPGRRLYMGPKNRILPIHCAVMTGRACNNNSATEVWNIITMNELLTPITGPLEIMRDGKVMIGRTGHIISVGIGMAVGEEYGRSIPKRAFHVGQTAHKSGNKAQNLKAHIPIMTGDKKVLAKYILRALSVGMIPGRHIAPSPAVMSVARLRGVKANICSIESAAFFELDSIGYGQEWMNADVPLQTPEYIIEHAQEIIPGCEDARLYDARDVAVVAYV